MQNIDLFFIPIYSYNFTYALLYIALYFNSCMLDTDRFLMSGHNFEANNLGGLNFETKLYRFRY